MIRILIVEDDPIIAQDIAEHLGKMGYKVAAIAYNADEAFHQLAARQQDMVLIDINLGTGMDGIEVARKLNQSYHLPFVFLTSHASPGVLQEAKQTRPHGYIVKPFNEKDLFATLEIAWHNHNRNLAPDQLDSGEINEKLEADLTGKEIEVLIDMFEGKTNRELSDKHFISLNTVKTHIRHIYDKLGVHSRPEAMALLRKKFS